MYNILFFIIIILFTQPAVANDVVFVKTSIPIKKEFYKEITIIAECVNIDSKDYFATTDGIVDSVPERAKKDFKKGEVILSIDKSISASQKALAEADFKQATLTFKNFTSLFQKNIISRTQLEKAEIAYHLAKSKLEEAKKLYEHKIIHAPFDGEISAIQYNKGERVKTEEFLFSITSNNPKKLLRFSIPKIYKINEKDVSGYVTNGGKNYKLEEISISKSLSKDFSNYSATSIVKNDNNLEHNSYIAVKLQYDTHEAISIPEASVIKSDGKNKVFILEGDKAKLIEVTLGDRNEGLIEVTSNNLSREIQIITEGIQKIADGQLVEVSE